MIFLFVSSFCLCHLAENGKIPCKSLFYSIAWKPPQALPFFLLLKTMVATYLLHSLSFILHLSLIKVNGEPEFKSFSLCKSNSPKARILSIMVFIHSFENKLIKEVEWGGSQLWKPTLEHEKAARNDQNLTGKLSDDDHPPVIIEDLRF